MILDRFLVTGQAAIVTASGRGIGAATAVALAEAGADVVLAARTEDQLRTVAKQVEAVGRRAVVVPGDLTDFDLMTSLAETAFTEFGRLDIIVNNMGGTMPRPLLDTSPRFLEEAFRFNVSAGHALIRAAVPRMLEGDHPGGAIVSISSVMGHVAGRGYVGYGTVKGALEQYTRLASRIWRPGFASTPSASGRPQPRRSTSSCRATSSAPPWRTRHHCGVSGMSMTSPQRFCTWCPQPARMSPARSSRLTAACSRRTSNSHSPISKRPPRPEGA